MVEKRINERVNPPKDSFVVNQLNDNNIGRIVDVSLSGFLLAGREKVNSGMIFQLELQIPDADNKVAHIQVGAECIWADSQPSGLTFAGFHIIDVAEADLKLLKGIIQQLVKS